MARLDVSWRRYQETPFATAFGILAVNSALNLFLAPERAPAHALVKPMDYLWAGFYGLGGLLLLLGIGARLANVEAAGCVAFAGGALVNAVAFVVVFHSWSSAFALLAFAWAAGVRTRHLARGQILILTAPAVEVHRAGE